MIRGELGPLGTPGTPVLIGLDSVSSSTTTVVGTVDTAAAVGDLLVVFVGSDGSVMPSSVADSRGNTYQADDAGVRVAGTYAGRVFSAVLTTALQVGDTVTATYAGSTGTWDKGIALVKVPGVWDSTRVDRTAQGSSSTGSAWATSDTGTLQSNTVLVIGYGVHGLGNNSTATSSTPGGGASEIFDDDTGSYFHHTAHYRQHSTGGTVNASGTWAGITTVPWGAIVVAYREAAGAPQSTGQKSPTQAQSIAEAPWSDDGWNTPTNVFADDAATANVIAASFDSPDQTFVLKAYGFDFSTVPDNATIVGVTARVNAFYRSGQGSGSIDLAQLLDTARAKVGTNKAATAVPLTTTTTTVHTFGGASDLWGNALTPAWIKDPDFGIALGVLATAANADVDVDHVTLEVTYTVPSTTVVGVSLSPTYVVVGVAGAQLAPTYTVRALAGVQLAPAYTVRTLAGVQLAPTYAVRAAAAASLTTSYQVAGVVGVQLATSYVVRVPVAVELAATYAVRALAGAQLAAAYQVFGLGVVGAQLAATYLVRALAAADVAATYLVRTLAGVELAASYAVLRAKMAQLADDFNDGTLDAAKWTGENVAETGGRLILTSADVDSWAGLDAIDAFDLTESSAHVELRDVPAAAYVDFYLWSAASGSVGFVLDAGLLRPYVSVAGTPTWLGDTAWNPAAMRFLRIRETAGLVSWERSADAVTWTTVATLSSPAWIDELAPGLWWHGSGGTQTLELDNFNVTPAGVSLAATYAVRALAGLELAPTYAVRALAADDVAATYLVRTLAGLELAPTYAVRALAADDVAATYAVRAVVGVQLATSYAIVGFGLAGVNLAATYAVRTFAGAQLAAAYTVRTLAGAQLVVAYQLEGVAGAQLVAGYAVRTFAGAQLAAAYTVRTLAGVELALAYAIGGAVAADLAVVYRLLGFAGVELELAYRVRELGEAEPAITRSTGALVTAGVAGVRLAGSGVTLATVEREGRTDA